MSQSTTNEWYVFDAGTIPKKTCNKIWKAVGRNWMEATLDITTKASDEERRTGIKGDFKSDPKMRISDIAWCRDQWLYDIIWPYMEAANERAGWKYDIRAAESMQITRYKKGGFYNFHTDGRGDHISTFDVDSEFLHGRVRKLSMSVMLNDNFDGGAFEFASYSKEKCNITPIEATAGSVIIFPSSMEHRVAPVTKGTRYSLVVWFVGPPFV